MTAKEILTRLEGAKPESKGWKAKCPAHDDKSPSLSITEGSDGRQASLIVKRTMQVSIVKQFGRAWTNPTRTSLPGRWICRSFLYMRLHSGRQPPASDRHPLLALHQSRCGSEQRQPAWPVSRTPQERRPRGQAPAALPRKAYADPASRRAGRRRARRFQLHHLIDAQFDRLTVVSNFSGDQRLGNLGLHQIAQGNRLVVVERGKLDSIKNEVDRGNSSYS